MALRQASQPERGRSCLTWDVDVGGEGRRRDELQGRGPAGSYLAAVLSVSSIMPRA